MDLFLHIARRFAAVLKLPDWLDGLAIGALGEEAQGIRREEIGAPKQSRDPV